MDFPPEEWDIFPTEDFELAEPRDPGECGAEVMVQIRNNGRIMDHFRLAIGGSAMIEVAIKLRQVIEHNDIPDLTANLKIWPRDVKIRRNMTTSNWFDLLDLVKSRDVVLMDPEVGEEVDPAGYITHVSGLNGDKSKTSCSMRWAVTAGHDNLLYLNLMSLPATLSSFSGRPVYHG